MRRELIPAIRRTLSLASAAAAAPYPDLGVTQKDLGVTQKYDI
jgi:hypothetical protein